MKFEFDGMDALTQRLQKMEHDSKGAENEALQEAAKVMQQATESGAPVRTGNLKGRIQISDVENGEIQVYVDQQGKAYYGYFLEYGTSKMRAQPFMGPAFMKSKLKMQQAMADSLKKALGLF